ncbi:MAG: hypothetical protein AB1714_00740 [Acidobacteriota bacterium]
MVDPAFAVPRSISGISASPGRRHCALQCPPCHDNIQENDRVAGHSSGQVPEKHYDLVALDIRNIHEAQALEELLSHTSHLHRIPLLVHPAELRTDEGVWQHLKISLADGHSDSESELIDMLSWSVRRLAATHLAWKPSEPGLGGGLSGFCRG